MEVAISFLINEVAISCICVLLLYIYILVKFHGYEVLEVICCCVFVNVLRRTINEKFS